MSAKLLLSVLVLLVTITAIKMAHRNAGVDIRNLKSLFRQVHPPPKKEYSITEWNKILKKLRPKADNPYAKKIWQPSSAGRLKNGASGMIVGGEYSAKGQFPWQAAITIDSSWFCGGSLILENFVMTAAHCAYQRSSFQVTVGVTYLYASGGTTITTTQKYVHPNYNSTSLANDIALLKFSKVVKLNSTNVNLRLVKLPPLSAATNTFNKVAVRASGYGQTSEDPFDLFGGSSPYLIYADLTVISNAECVTYYGTMYVTAATICTKQGTKAPCHGDSGGALVYYNATSKTWLQIGVVSFGSDEGCLQGPTGFTRVTSFLGWISGITGKSFATTG